MKSINILLFALILPTFIWAQSPANMSYQAVIRDATGSLVDSTNVGIQISILQNSPNGTVVYVETHQASTNANGLVSLEIGNGTALSGNISNINWGNGPYFLKSETDPNGGSNYTIVGSSPLLAVPYALHSKIADSIQGGIVESDPLFTNSTAATITAADTARWGQQTINTDDQNLTFSGTNLSIENGNAVDLASLDTDTQIDSSGIANFGYVAGAHTVDTQIDSTGIANLGYVAGPHTIDTDDQTLSLSGTNLSIADGNSIDLSTINTDDQTLSLSGTNLNITNGNSLDLSSIDTDTQLDSSGISNLGYVAGPHTIDTDDQTLSLSGTNLSIADGNSIDLSTINTDDQTLSLSGTNLNITNGNSLDLSSIDTDTQLDSSGISNLGYVAGPHTIDTDDQTLSLSGTNLSIADGNSIDLSTINTDDQTLSLSGTNLNITNGNSLDLSSIDTDTQLDSSGIANLGYVAGPHTIDTDDQTLSLSGTNLSIVDGNSIDLSSIDTDTDTQIDSSGIATLGYVAGAHTIDTDDQTLSLSGTSLSIADGNSVDLSSIDTDTDTQIDSSGISNLGYVAGPHTIDTDDQTLSLSGTSLSIADGNSVDLSSIDTDTDTQIDSSGISNLGYVAGPHTIDTDDQTLSLSGTSLSIADGNSVDISSIDTDTDDQTLSLSGTSLSIADGNSVDLSSIDTDTQIDSSGIAALGFVAGNHVAGSDKQLSFNDNGAVGADAELVYDKSNNHMAIGSTTVNPNAALEIKSTTGGLLLPRMTTAQRDAISPEVGTIIFNTDSGKIQGYTGFPVSTNASYEDINGFLGTLSITGQSFTATANGTWTKLMLDFASSSNGTLSIFNGNTVSGTSIHTQAFNVSSGQQEIVLSSPIQLVAGQQYTFYTGVNCNYYPFGTYNGGNAFTGTFAFSGDLWFKVLTGESQWQNLHP